MSRLILFLLAAPLWADNALWVDLSGDWRLITGVDRPEFARPEFDDRAWMVITLPPQPAQPLRGTGWMRKRVPLPDGIDRSQLALTLGTIGARYELYVNGQLAGSSTERYPDTRIGRPATFRLPAIEGPELLIAVRRTNTFGTDPRLQGFDRGPWVLTYALNAPVNAGPQALERLALENAPALLFATVYLMLALIGFGTWWGDRARPEMLWFALLTLVRCSDSAITFAGAALDWPLASFVAVGSSYFRSFLAVVLYAEMILAVTQWRGRWLHALLALGSIGFLMVTFTGLGLRFTILMAAQFAGGVLLILRIAWSSRGQGPLTGRDGLLRLALILPCLNWIANAGTYVVFRQSGTAYLVPLWGFRWVTYDFGLAAVSCFIVFLLIQRIQFDRREKARLGGELAAARSVQSLLLPGSQPGIEAVYLPATEVGGDFWHCFDNRLIVIGDVSGKGLKAAMVVSLITGMLDRRHADSPAALLAELNRALSTRLEDGFVTCCVVRLEPDGHLTAANAGHPAPYLNGQELDLPPGLPLGVVPEAEYTEASVSFEGSLTMLSDGVIEATNPQGELFGFDRTRTVSPQSAQEIAEAAQQWGQNDDITVVTVRRALA